MKLTLREKIAQKQRQATELARRARRPEADPRDAYEAGAMAEKLAAEAQEMTQHVASNEKLIEELEKLLNYLAESGFESVERDICRERLTEAVMWLERESG